MRHLLFVGFLAWLLPVPAGAADEPRLTIRAGEQVRSLSRSELLSRPGLAAIHVDHDPAYGGKPMDYPHAIPLRPLFEGLTLPPKATLEFKCLDGFSAPLSRERLLESASTPYLAIETPDEHWPAGVAKKSPGPFYLIWKNPEKAKIGTEEWPFQLSGFSVEEPLENIYPKIVPGGKLAKASPVMKGFKVFTKNCFACHTLNREGKSQLGPDLNVPMSPTEYLREAALKKLVRDPQSLRSWPQSKMTGFSKADVSDAELGDLLAYLKYMAKHRAP